MNGPTVPWLPEGLTYFADWRDLVFAAGGIVSVTLLIVWWNQQTRHWHRVAILTFLIAFGLGFGSLYLFEIPPHYAGCATGCAGWRGYPLPVALITFDGQTQIGLFDFALNVLLLWVIVLLASLFLRLLGSAVGWEQRSLRMRTLVLLGIILVSWALLPRYVEPPQPRTSGEELRLVNNAQRAAESTYRITGFWIQRLALEDLRQLSPNPLAEAEPNLAGVRSQVCLRGYTFFYIPWRRYRVNLEPTGVTALDLAEVPLDGSCWEASEAS